MKLKIDQKIFEKFSELNVGVVIAKGINAAGTAEEIIAQIRKTKREIKEKYDAETLSSTPKIAVWIKAYSAFGAKPKENKSSVENLYRMVLSGNSIRQINKLVDIYNLISLKHMLPAGGEDLDKMTGDIVLTFAEKNEPAVMLLGDKDARPPHEGEVIYKDNISAICRRWNWREADRTKLTEETKNCILVVEGLPPAIKEEVERSTKELKELIEKHCGGTIIYQVLNKNNPEITI